MKVLTVYAHNDRHSFCRGVLERFTAGLADAGHTNEVVDLYAIKFDPVFRDQGRGQLHQRRHPDRHPRTDGPRATGAAVLPRAAPTVPGITSHARQVAGRDRRHDPKPNAQGRARTTEEGRRRGRVWRSSRPMHFCSFPSILKGWIDRVFTLDFAFGLTSEGWHGDINGRIPLLQHQRALIMTSTIFDEHAYDDGIRDAIGKVIDDWGFRYPGIEDVEHVYFYAATAAPPETINAYLDQAYQLGKDFGLPERREHRSQPTRPNRVMGQLPDRVATARERRPDLRPLRRNDFVRDHGR